MPKENTTLVNGMSPVTKDSGGTVAGFPDVCKTPGPAGPVPVPYPNVAESDSLEGGSRSVTINDAPVGLSSSCLGKSTGNEAGSAGGGVASGKTKGAAHPANYSFDVRIEGKNVVRNFDLFTLNDHNVPPSPIVQPQVSRPLSGRVDTREESKPVESCEYCGKEKHPFDTKGRIGGNLGSSAVLGRNMLQGKELATHPWYVGPFSVAAHHLICLEALDNEQWAKLCPRFGYHPDRKENGVFLPMKMASACELRVAVHRGSHAEGHAFDLHLPYPKAVMTKLKEVEVKLERGAFCSDPDALIRRLDQLSAEILGKVASFTWTLTRDGLDYAPGGRGCSGLKSIQQKPSSSACPQERRHSQKHTVSGQPLAKQPLRVGE
jgi:hypothetical protein